MIRFLYGDSLADHSRLAQSMFRDRAKQFSERLGWEVSVDDAGEERDQYDALNPLYVIWQRPDGLHGGSMRFLPTTGRCMTHEHFLHLSSGTPVQSPFIWECTRFRLSESASPTTAARLMLAGVALMEGQRLEHFLGVFDAPMERIYRQIGASPEILGSVGQGRTKTSLGLLAYTPAAKARLVKKAKLSEAVMLHWYLRAFGPKPSKKSDAA